ncbi:MAG TPA: nucleotidyltransferase domain-containing protein [Actinoplanes sp.]|nr:nucleotidyltransferase domain-containing protein [Actinoplanes sp.]
MLTTGRVAEAAAVIETVHGWAADQDDVAGVLVVGSWARGAARMDSDLDVVVLTDTAAHAEPEAWLGLLGGRVVRQQQWGPLREIRVRRPSGFEVEMGVAPVSWAATTPVDAGTFRVVRDGHRIVHDPAGIVAALAEKCR